MAHAVNKEADALLDKEFKVLDHGFVRLVDYMGTDQAIVQAARVSYGEGTKKVSEDRGLIRYLLRHRHTSPFEMVEFKFHVKLPIFVARQWIRHRSASVNEYSGRYSVMKEEFYIPQRSDVRYQSTVNKQGRSEEVVPDEMKDRFLDNLDKSNKESFGQYRQFHRMVLDDLGYNHIPIYSPHSNNGYAEFGLNGTNFRKTAWKGLVGSFTKLFAGW